MLTPMESMTVDPLSKDRVMTLRGLAALLIIVFHCSFYYGFEFPDVGHLAVAMFLFFSGFGLEMSLHRKKGYLRGFMQKRVFGILLRYWVILFAIGLAGAILHPGSNDIVDAMSYAMFRVPHWFVTEILVFYMLFFVTSMLIRDNRIRLAVVTMASLILMFMMFTHYDTTLYYKSGIAFAFGMVWYHLRDRIGIGIMLVLAMASLIVLLLTEGRASRGVSDVLAVSMNCIASMLLLMAMMSVDLRRGWFIHVTILIVGLMVSSVCQVDAEGFAFLMFTMLCVLILSSRTMSRPFFLMGTMSFEVYLMHETFYRYVWGEVIQYEPVAFAISLVISLLVSYILYRLSNTILKKCDEGLRMRDEPT